MGRSSEKKVGRKVAVGRDRTDDLRLAVLRLSEEGCFSKKNMSRNVSLMD